MTLAPGSRIGVYEISEPIGAGGMGEVFRAVDTNLHRTVAIKVLPSSLAADTERLARFEREAHTLAALNHANIAQVYGFEKSGDPALVMEFVDGPTLADRIAAGPIPIDESIAIAVQIADALESAHDLGIVHRDLKPANIKVRPDGTVKVLDFGLAKTVTREASAASTANSPTITTPAMTHAGVVLGTASYMSPEQAKGRVVDRRADIWAFGCVLFEMLTGRRAFNGEDVGDVMVAILRDEPKWELLPGATPPHVRALIARCLQKDSRKRLPHIGVARLDLTEPHSPVVAASRKRTLVIGGAVAAVAFAIGATAVAMWPRSQGVDSTPLRLKMELGTDRPVEITGTVAISLDGTRLAFVGRSAGDPTAATFLFVRRFDELNAQQLDGTEGATAPFFSPDGRWIAYFDFAHNQLKRIAVTGGRVTVICDAAGTRGGSWGDDDVIVFAGAANLQRVPASGGTPATIFTAKPGEPVPFWPQVLPGSKHVLYSEALGSDPSTGVIVLRGLADGSTTELAQGRFAHYAGSGLLTFFRSGTMYAVDVDPVTLERRGDPEPIVDDVAQTIIGAAPMVAVSRGGTVVYSPSAGVGGAVQAPLMWLSMKGPLVPLRATPASWLFPRFSPDGNRIAMSIYDGRQADIWVYDIARDVMTRVTTDPTIDVAPVWTPDGRGLVFGSGRGSSTSVMNLYWQRADGTGAARRLTETPIAQIPDGIDAAGRRVILHQGDPATSKQSIAAVAVEPDGEGLKGGGMTELVGGPFLKANPRISPDGKWILYVASDSGAFELYVQPFQAGAARVQVSSGGASIAVWSPSKNELYYWGPPGLMVVPFVVKDGTFVPEKPRRWTETPFSAIPPVRTYGPSIDLHPDGRRFAVAPPDTATAATTPARGGQLVLMRNVLAGRER